MIEQFQQHINHSFSFLKNKRLLLAISGGLDSVVLTHLCKSLNLNISLAHCNFSLRNDESDTDEAFVEDLANQHKLRLFKKQFDTKAFAKNQKLSIQLAARKLRYQWFEELCKTHEFDYLLTAHHADDNLETLLINLSRGTGFKGLLGIPEHNGYIVRPLLPFIRESILDYAKSNNISWREDSSNSSTKYVRNKLRHDVIPILKELNPDILKAVNTTISNLKDTQDIIEESVDAILKRAITSIDEDKIEYNITEFKKLNNPKAYLQEIFSVYGFTAFNDIEYLLTSQSGKIVTSKTHQLLKNRDTLILTEYKSDSSFKVDITDFKPLKTPLGLLTFEQVDSIDLTDNIDNHSVYVDGDMLKFPLVVSTKKIGDYFYPLGMKGKKKLSKYFKDEKMSLIEKEKALILRCSNDIIWVINYRLDNRFKISKTTKSIIKISIQ